MKPGMGGVKLGRAYEKIGQCEVPSCQNTAGLYRRTIDGRKVAMAVVMCQNCFVRMEAGLLKSMCPLCTCELRADLGYKCGFCRTMGFGSGPES